MFHPYATGDKKRHRQLTAAHEGSQTNNWHGGITTNPKLVEIRLSKVIPLVCDFFQVPLELAYVGTDVGQHVCNGRPVNENIKILCTLKNGQREPKTNEKLN
jgi:hypothetical protein